MLFRSPISGSSSPLSGCSDMYYYDSNSIITSTSTQSVPTDRGEMEFAELPHNVAARVRYNNAMAGIRKWLDPSLNAQGSPFALSRKHRRHVIKIYNILYPPSEERRTPEARYLRVERRRRREYRKRDRHEQRRRQKRLQKLPHNLL